MFARNRWEKHKTETTLRGKNEERLRIGTHLDTKGFKAKDIVIYLGVLIDCDLSFNNHVKVISKSTFYQLKNI